MCILEMPQACGGGDPAIFVAPEYASIVSLNNVNRCPAASMPMQHPLNCLFFHIRHGYEPNTHDCAACTDAMKRSPPPQMRQSPLRVSLELGRYDDGPVLPRTNTGRRANNNPFILGLSSFATSRAEASGPAPQAPQDGVSFYANHANHANLAPGRVDMASLGGVIRPRQNHHLSRQQAQANLFNPATPPMRPRSTSRNRDSNADPMVETTKLLLEESLECNSVLTRENEELKKENANLKRWLAQNGPRF